ncbi:MAG: UvrD-helicase domain-containing protein [Muribaculaceae bacterium]|nr:UvrD-helicase domain-containing protein [Muribaculaceae bacterium]
MLKIQRASAGSGKTYTLAKNYILNLIAFENNNGEWQLRNQRQIEDNLLHILAITFTNKATNEMKQRIVKNLADLSKAANTSNIDEKFLKKTPYLKEFQSLLGISYQEIGKASEIALKSILNNYSLFRISTIDSFFQEILRTFTYEANLNNSYQLEIDSTFVTDSAIDSSIQELDSHPSKMGNSSFWMKTIIQQEAQNSQLWNPFNKKDVKRSVYANIKNTLFKLEKEDFKEVKEIIDSYFDTNENIENLKNLYIDFQKLALEERKSLLGNIHKKARKLKDWINQKNIEPQLFKASQIFNHIEIALSLDINGEFNNNYKEYLTNKSIFKKAFRDNYKQIDQLAIEFYNSLTEWKEPNANSYFKNWLVYSSLLPYFGLLLEVRYFLSKVLENNNLVQLSDTSYILKKIIGDEDSPFIYERLGNKIEHYLIDEFQDTSKMQWDVIHPLLKESDSKGQDSLIIGDPKQSIYRFRNAYNKLITEDVPNLFPNHLAAGLSLEDNTNWRSHSMVVKFNNYFFKILADILSKISLQKGLPTDFNDIYANVVQFPHNQEGKGFVQIKAYTKPIELNDEVTEEDNDDETQTKKSWFEEQVLSEIGPLISSLINRGYLQNEIAILVNTNEAGKKIIQALIDFNDSLPKGAEKINFISEESLLVSSSRAVDIVIGVLEKLSTPGNLYRMENSPEKSSEKEDNATKYVKWNKIKLSFNIYSRRHLEMDPVDRIISFLNQTYDNSIHELIETLTAPSLASMVEAIIYLFLDVDLKNLEALYLSSLQDLVNEYSVNHSNDPASFLEWWKSRGCRMSVSTPEGANAVQIMTIHKSKGLEFKCVILPYASESFSPNYNKEEWRWVKTNDLPNLNLPPILPIKTTSELMGSKHETIYREYLDQVLTDKINMYYVAFTRARNELYIFTKIPEKNSPSLSTYIKQILFDKKPYTNLFSEEELSSVISTSQLNIFEEEKLIRIGEPFTEEEIEEEHEKEKKISKSSIHYIDDYFINEKRPQLRSLASKVSPSGEFGSIPPIN